MDDPSQLPGPTDVQTARQPRRSAVIASAALFALILLLIVALVVAQHRDGKASRTATTATATDAKAPSAAVKPAAYILPDLTGHDFAGAKLQLEQAGMKVRRKDAGETGLPPGAVASQLPKAGSKLRTGALVQLSVSAAPRHAALIVPTVTGQSAEQATKSLKALGLVVKQAEASSALSRGAVLAQRPAGGTQAKAGGTVTLSVSSGAGQISMPQLAGKAAAVAARQVTLLGLAVSQAQQTVPKGSASVGKVVSQTPPAGTKVAAGGQVVLVVGSPSAQANVVSTSVASLMGKSEVEARSLIQQAGLVPQVQVVKTAPDGIKPDTVSRQAPAAGQKVRRGSKVLIVIYRP